MITRTVSQIPPNPFFVVFLCRFILFLYLCNQFQTTMEVIQSFTIDHTRLKPGIYVSREDKGFTTFDLRITEPNKEPAVDCGDS